MTQKSQGGGVCVFVNQWWYKNITVRNSVCIEGVDLLSVSRYTFYPPVNFCKYLSDTIFITSFIRFTSGLMQKMRSLLLRKSHRNYSPSHLMHLVSSLVTLTTVIWNFYQYMSCPTRTKLLICAMVMVVIWAYKSVALPPLGSVENTILYYPYLQAFLEGQIRTIREKSGFA